MALKGFWSYVHADDQAEHGRIAQLARDVAQQFEMLTGEPIELFLDQDALEWGDKWRAKIDSSLASIAFFIPVITPRYFRSAECRREFQFFARQAKAFGVTELVLPVLYVDFPGLHDEDADDDLVALIREFQWQDWSDLRFAERESGDYRRGVTKLAQRLVDANAAAEKVDAAAAAEALASSDPSSSDEELGIIDRIAAAEDAMPAWNETLEKIGLELERIRESVERGTAGFQRSDAQGKGYAGRLRVARQVATDLDAPAGDLRELGNEFASHLHTIDAGIREIIEQSGIAFDEDPSIKDEVCEFFGLVRDLARASTFALEGMQGMLKAIAPVERLSRDLRPPLRAMRQGLTSMLEGQEVTREWVALLDASPVGCDADDSTWEPPSDG
ncbi:TIR domain-containing protein [Solirubrobacter pauli]|uniref:TIR domain-containing protein n=1 Tax=Solirubrobacter pauli TaxID=166793 RepID=A0A660LCE8_9ACTN|nr:toll/interleukin-1 receptor domain-containing protein [Solirubrobacter pauli]RKQ91915.1 TIR domain-containing protein [Solirubrobacter pauli]